MLTPYRIVEENEDDVVYEFITIYVYVLYLILVFIVISFILKMRLLEGLGFVLMILYFLLVSIPYMKLGKKMKKAAAEATVEFSGSKWSFANPLRVRIKKKFL